MAMAWLMVGVDALSLQSRSTITLEGAICHLLKYLWMLSLMKVLEEYAMRLIPYISPRLIFTASFFLD